MQRDSSDINTLVSQCDNEPIHLLEHVQHYGFLIAVSTEGIVTHISENVGDFLDVEASQLLGENLWERVDKELAHAIRGAQHQSVIIGKPCHLKARTLKGATDKFNIAVHAVGGTVVMEFEPEDATTSYDNVLSALMNQISQLKDIPLLYDGIVEALKFATGFDRVMLYQFLSDGAGEVVAEAKNADMVPFLGLRYPASDIPKQARALYKRTLTRTIASVHAKTSPLLSHDDNAPALDLSQSKLRAVSPIHIQYLKNMGVVASMSISIIIEGELWGLIACHHNSDKIVSVRLLSQLELFSEIFSLELSNRLIQERIRVSEKATSTFTKVLSNLALGQSLANAIVEQLELLKGLIDIDGIGCCFSDEYVKNGAALSHKKVKMLTEYLAKYPDAEVHRLDNLVAAHEALSDNKVAGVLAIKISSSPMDYIFLYRKSITQKVTWAGNPEKRVEKRGNENILTPRSSFEKWIEFNATKSISWTDLDMERAKSIRLGVMELTIRHLHEKETIQREAKKRLELLIGELNHRVRNILNLVNAIVGQTSQTKNDIDTFVNSLSSRISALALGHDQLTHASWKSISFRKLLHNELKAYMVNESAFKIAGPDISITAYAVTPVVLVFHEMITNAAKYGALSATSNDGRVAITWSLDEEKSCVIEWEEKGGPPVAEMASEGFGMTVIKSVIPHELGGKTELFPDISGLKARFTIPKKHVELGVSSDEGDVSSLSVTKSSVTPLSERKKTASAFIVEDNLLISLDLQRKLRSVGFKNVEIFGDVGSARAALAQRDPSMLFLDVHLGNENSFQLGEDLKKRGVPFFFITGNGAAIALPHTLLDITVLTKPVDTEILEKEIKNLGFES